MHIPQEDQQDAQRWAEEEAADEEAELTYRRMLEDEEEDARDRASLAAAAEDAERYADAAPIDVEHDLF